MKITIGMFIGMVVMVGQSAAQVYVGGSAGLSNLNYDTEGLLYEKISTNNNASIINAAVNAVGGDVNVSSDKTAEFKKIFVGKRLNKFFGVEMFYLQTQEYSVDININATANVGFFEGNDDNNVSSDARASIKGNGQATADFKGYGLRLNGFMPLSKKIDVLVSAGVMMGKSTLTTSYNVNGVGVVDSEVNAAYSGSTYIGPTEYNARNISTTGFSLTETEKSTEKLIVPTFALGVDYKLTPNFSIRGEAELFGLPVNGLGIVVFSTGLLYNF